jgi:hypothetical protein
MQSLTNAPILADFLLPLWNWIVIIVLLVVVIVLMQLRKRQQ